MEQIMSSIRFDKAQYIKSLRNAGQTQEAAEAFADALDNALEQTVSPLATKQDVLAVKQDMLTMKQELKLDIQALKAEILKYIGIGLVASTTLTVTIIGILITYLTR